MKKRTSIHTIAKELDLSATTISFIINGKAKEKRISEEVTNRVQAYLQEIDYKPNLVAKSLRTGKTNIIGMLMEDISDPFFSSIARGVEEGFSEKGYKLFFTSTKNKKENAISILQILKEHQVDAYIIAPTPGLEEAVSELMVAGKPVVLFDRYFPSIKTNNILIDNKAGAYEGTQTLFRNQYKNIAFVTLASDQIQMMDRYFGYLQSIRENKQAEEIKLEIPYNLNVDGTAKLVKSFLKKNKHVGAILFATNYLAIGGLHAIKELGIHIPNEMGVVGFDDNTNFSLFSPSISAVAQPVKGIADKIVETLYSLLDENGAPGHPLSIVLPVSLIQRESSIPNKK